MAVQSLTNKLNNIELKVRQLALRLERLQNENSTLLLENKQLKSELAQNNSKLDQMEERVARSKVALDLQRESNPESSKKLRKEIDQYITEVEKCIEWLQNS
jgi:predicted  nucleic acid-binding Zn-ribbon protein